VRKINGNRIFRQQVPFIFKMFGLILMLIYGHTQKIWRKSSKIAPQGNVTNIKLSLVGIKGVWVDKQTGELSIDTTLGITKMSHPIAYQDIDNIRKYAKVDYVVYGNSYGFVLSGYDPRYTLVIDPILSSTFIGGAAEDFLSAVSCSLEIFSTSNFPNDNSLLFTFARCNSFNSLISSIG
jgi:hypothetical protein